MNAGKRPVLVFGMERSCACLTEAKLPIVLAPEETRVLPFTIEAGGQPRRIDETVRLFTDCPSRPIVALRIVGSIVEPNSAPR